MASNSDKFCDNHIAKVKQCGILSPVAQSVKLENHLFITQVMADKPAIDSRSGFLASEPLENQGPQEPKKIAHLHPPINKAGVRYTGRYDVTFDGEIVVEGSRDPETDLARALLAKGTTGMVKVLDANTGEHRTTVNIEKAAKLRTQESGTYPRFRWVETCAGSPPACEEDLVVPTMPGDDDKAVA